jgi:nicotinate phosphoribosyltransferase
MSHQYIQMGQGLDGVRLSESQSHMLDMWAREFRGNLGIALSDTLGFDAFLADFDLFYSKLYDGCRHDSGSPFDWCEKLIRHYETLGIDPRTKSAVFSDGLTFPLALDLCTEFGHRIRTSFGIGTNLTNDGAERPLQIVIKLVSVNGRPVAKISDSPGKGMCEDEEHLRQLKLAFNIHGGK